MLCGGQVHATKGEAYVQEAFLPCLVKFSEQTSRCWIALHNTTRSNTQLFI